MNPSENFLKTWLLIIREAPKDIPKINSFLNYAFNTWVSNSARFPRKIWNRCNNFAYRTINHLEGFHNALNREFGKAHPNIFEFINGIRKFQADYEIAILQLENGKMPPRKNKKYAAVNEKIKHYTTLLNDGQISELRFLDAVSFLLHLQSHDKIQIDEQNN